jgi:hypothetical protein
MGYQTSMRYQCGHRNGIWDIDMGYRYGIWDISVGDDYIDTVMLDIDMGFGTSIWEMTVSILSSWISVWDMGHRYGR